MYDNLVDYDLYQCNLKKAVVVGTSHSPSSSLVGVQVWLSEAAA